MGIQWECTSAFHWLQEAVFLVRNEISYNILSKFSIPMKLVDLNSMCLNDRVWLLTGFGSVVRSIWHFNTLHSSLLHKRYYRQSCVYCRFLVASTNGRCSHSSGLLNCPQRKISASDSDSSLTTEPQQSSNCLQLLTGSGYKTSAQTA